MLHVRVLAVANSHHCTVPDVRIDSMSFLASNKSPAADRGRWTG